MTTAEIKDMASKYIDYAPEEFPTREEYIALIDQNIDKVIDYAETLGYTYNEHTETFALGEDS